VGRIEVKKKRRFFVVKLQSKIKKRANDPIQGRRAGGRREKNVALATPPSDRCGNRVVETATAR